MSCDRNRSAFFTAAGASPTMVAAFGDAQRATAALTEIYDVAMRRTSIPAAVATAQTRLLFVRFTAAGIRPPVHSTTGLPSTAAQQAYAQVYTTIVAAESGSELPELARTVRDKQIDTIADGLSPRRQSRSNLTPAQIETRIAELRADMAATSVAALSVQLRTRSAQFPPEPTARAAAARKLLAETERSVLDTWSVDGVLSGDIANQLAEDRVRARLRYLAGVERAINSGTEFDAALGNPVAGTLDSSPQEIHTLVVDAERFGQMDESIWAQSRFRNLPADQAITTLNEELANRQQLLIDMWIDYHTPNEGVRGLLDRAERRGRFAQILAMREYLEQYMTTSAA